MRPKAFLLLFLLAVAASAAACQSKPDRTGQSTKGVFVPSFDVLWEVASQEMRHQGFTANLDESSKETHTMVSRWETQLSPMSMRGYREQATLSFHPVEGRENYWTVEANVIRQVNKNLKEPSNPIRVDWDTGTRVPESEHQLVWSIEAFFLGHDASPEFRARYGLPPARPVIPAPPPANPETSSPSTAR